MFGYRQPGHTHEKKMSWNSFLTEDEEHEESLAGFIKRTQVFTEHSFHVKEDIFEDGHA